MAIVYFLLALLDVALIVFIGWYFAACAKKGERSRVLWCILGILAFLVMATFVGYNLMVATRSYPVAYTGSRILSIGLLAFLAHKSLPAPARRT